MITRFVTIMALQAALMAPVAAWISYLLWWWLG